MTGTKAIQFFLLISLMIFLTHALEAFLTDGIGNFSFETVIDYRNEYVDGRVEKIHYNGCSNKRPLEAKTDTRMVIVYIKSKTGMENTVLRVTRLEQRRDIAKILLDHNCQLLYLAIGNFHFKMQKTVIGEFLRDVIKGNPAQSENFQIVTVGLTHTMNLTYGTPPNELKKYDEREHIVGYDLLRELRLMG